MRPFDTGDDEDQVLKCYEYNRVKLDDNYIGKYRVLMYARNNPTTPIMYS